jgi:hypothetical protein
MRAALRKLLFFSLVYLQIASWVHAKYSNHDLSLFAPQEAQHTRRALPQKPWSTESVLDTAVLWRAPPYKSLALNPAGFTQDQDKIALSLLMEASQAKDLDLDAAVLYLQKQRNPNTLRKIFQTLNTATLKLNLNHSNNAENYVKDFQERMNKDLQRYKSKFYAKDPRQPQIQRESAEARAKLSTLAGEAVMAKIDRLYAKHTSGSVALGDLPYNTLQEETDEQPKYQNLQVAYGRMSLIDLGVLIKDLPFVLDESLIRVYALSGFDDEMHKSILAIQGLKRSGQTDLSVTTETGIYQFHIRLDTSCPEDLLLKPSQSRSVMQAGNFHLAIQRMSLVSLPSEVNEYVLASRPDLLALKQVAGVDSEKFLKIFALASKDKAGLSDVVIATRLGVYKFTIVIGGNTDAQHDPEITLRHPASYRLTDV